jgi:hypothetical protein
LTHEHSNEFQHLDFPLEGLQREYDLGWKFEADTDGPPGWPAEPYLLLYISFRATTGKREEETLHYALTRSRWREQTRVGEEDRQRLRQLAVGRVHQDLLALEQGTKPDHLDAKHSLFL